MEVEHVGALLKIDSVMFFVTYLEKAAQFYSDVLGLKRVWTDEKRGMIGFVFRESDSEIVVHNDSSIHNPSFSFLVWNVEAFCKEYKANGGKVAREPFDVRCGKYAVVADPDGNELPIIDLTKFDGKPRYDQ